MKTPSLNLRLTSLLAIAIACFAKTVAAQTTYTWNGGGSDSLWGTGANWNGGNAPALGSIIQFDGSTRTSPDWNYGDYNNMNQIIFNSTIGSSFDLVSSLGRSIKLQNSGATVKIENQSSLSHTLDFANISYDNGGEMDPTSGDLNCNLNGTGSIFLDNNGTLHVYGNNAHTLTLGCVIANGGTGNTTGGRFTLEQNSTVIMNKVSTYTGETDINAGELRIGASGGISSSSAIYLGNGGATSTAAQLSLGTPSSSGGITFGNSFTVNPGSTGTRTLAGLNTSGVNIFSGTITLNASGVANLNVASTAGGTLQFSSGSIAVPAQADTLTFTPAASSTIDVKEAITCSGTTTGTSGNLVMNGAGTLLLENTANTYNGNSSSGLNATTISGGGILGIYGDTCLGLAPAGSFPGSIAFSGSGGTLQDTSGNILLNANRGISVASGVTATLDSAANTFTIPGVISGLGGIAKAGSGTLTLSGVNTYTGTTAINAGTVSISGNNGLGANTAPVSLNGGTLSFTTGQTGTHAITVGASGGTINVNAGTGQYYLHTANTLLGSGTLTLTGSGTLTANSGNLRVDQANTYSGNMILQSGGIFEYGVASAVGSGATFTVNNNGELAVQNNVTLPNAITVGGGTSSVLSFENGNGGIFSGNITLNANLTVGLRDWYNNATVRSGTVSGAISGTGGISVNSGTGTGGTLTLSGANTYTGPTTIGAATLSASSLDYVSSGTLSPNTSSSLGHPTTIANGTIAIGSTTTGGQLNYTGTGETSDRVINLAGTTGGATITQSGTSGLLKFTSDFTATGVGAKTLTLQGSTAGTGELGGNIVDSSSGATSITKIGTGTWTLSGTDTYTGGTRANGGILAISGTRTYTSGDFLSVNNVGNTVAPMVQILSGANWNIHDLNLAENANSLGAIYQSGGTFTENATGTSTKIGNNTSAYGYYKLSGGTFNSIGELAIANGSSSVGVVDVTGGTLAGSTWLLPGRGTGTASGLLNVTGGTVTCGANKIALNWAGTAGAISMLNVGGGAGSATVSGVSSTSVNNQMDVSTSTTSGTYGVVNLLANGTLTVNQVVAGQTAGTALINFNGGALAATPLNLGSTFMTSGNMDAVTVYGGGGTIDNGGTSITIGNALAAPTAGGLGVSGVTLSSGDKGSGYVGAPLVQITGGTANGGKVATAIANMVDDGSGKTLKVGSITVTSPGDYSVAPTGVSFSGGAATTAGGTLATFNTANGDSIATASSTSGGMTFQGSGTTTLSSGSSTYSGGTTLSSGTVLLGANSTGTPVTSGPLGTGTLNLGGGTLGASAATITVGNALNVTGTVTIGQNANNTATLSGALTGNGTLQNFNSGTANTGDNLFFTGDLSGFTGTISYTDSSANSSAYWRVGATGGATINLSGATLNLNAGSGTAKLFGFIDGTTTANTLRLSKLTGDGVFQGSYNGTAAFNTIEVGNGNASSTFSGAIGFTPNNMNRISLIKVGSGTLTLSGANIYISGTTINGGVINAGIAQNGTTSGPLGASGNITFGGGTLQFSSASSAWDPSSRIASGTSSSAISIDPNGQNVTFATALTASQSGGLTINDTAVTKGALIVTAANAYTGNTTITAGTLQLGNGSSTGKLPTASTITDNGTLAFNRNNAVVQGTDFSGSAINGTGGITQAGSGTTTLNAANGYSGPTTISAGKLIVSSTQTGTGAISVSDSANFGVNISGISHLSPASLTLGTSTGCTLEFNSVASTTTAPLTPASVTTHGTVTVNVNSGTFTVGSTYPLVANVSSTNGYSLTSAPLLTLGVAAHLTIATISSVNYLAMQVDSVSDIWTGTVNGTWDINTTANWSGHATKYSDGDNVLLDDTATGTTTITVGSQVNPGSVTLNNTSKSYSITSSGGNYIGGTGILTKNGTGNLTLAGPNTYTGTTTLNGGKVNAGFAETVGTSGPFGASAAANPGSIIFGGGTLQYSSANQNDYSGRFSTAGSQPISIDVNGQTVSFATALQGTGTSLMLADTAGGGKLTLSGNNTYTGTTAVNAGTLVLLGNNSGLTNATTVSGTLQVQGASALSSSTALTLNNGSTLSLQADADTTFAPASLAAFSPGNTYNFQVNSLNSPSGNGHTLTLSGQAGASTGNNTTADTINVSSTTGDTLKFGTTAYHLSGGSGAAWGGNNNNFNLTSANVILNGMDDSAGNGDVVLVLASTSGNTLTINGTVTVNGSRTIGATVNSGVLTLNNTVTQSGGANYGFFVNLNGGTLNLNNNAINNNASIGGTGNRAGFALAGGNLDNTSGNTVTLSANPTIGISGDFTFVGSNPLNLGTGSVTLTNGNRTVTVSANTLTIGGAIGDLGAGLSLIKAGNGTLALAGVNTYTGSTLIGNGTLALTGSGSLASTAITVHSNAAFDVSALASYTLNSSGTLTLRIDKTGATLSQGRVVSTTGKTLTYGGSLAVTATGDALANGDSFTLFTNADTYAGWFTSVTVPTLASGLSWDTNDVATSGTLDVYTFTTTTLTVSTLANTAATVSAAKLTAHASSPRGTPVAASASIPGHGTASISAGALTYTPTSGYSGSDTFTVTFQDGHGWQTMTVNVTVNAQNVGPQLTTQSAGGYASFTASGLPSTIYTVQISTNLADAPPFNDYLSVTSAPNGVINYTDTVSIDGHGGQAYYRLKQYVAP